MDSLNRKKSQFICPECSKVLSSKQTLKQHLNIHTGAKPFRCFFPACNAAFKHASQMSSHKLHFHKTGEPIKPEFDDFRSFIKLVTITLDSKRSKKFTVPPGPYSFNDAHLPGITSPQISVVLPGLESLNSL